MLGYWLGIVSKFGVEAAQALWVWACGDAILLESICRGFIIKCCKNVKTTTVSRLDRQVKADGADLKQSDYCL